MSDLISRSALAKDIQKIEFGIDFSQIPSDIPLEELIKIVVLNVVGIVTEHINEQPTAYDIEKVVAELEEEIEYQDKKADEADVFEEVSVSSARISMRKCYEHAIEIVRKGGVE